VTKPFLVRSLFFSCGSAIALPPVQYSCHQCSIHCHQCSIHCESNHEATSQSM